MKKLNVDDLSVESFPTASAPEVTTPDASVVVVAAAPEDALAAGTCSGDWSCHGDTCDSCDTCSTCNLAWCGGGTGPIVA